MVQKSRNGKYLKLDDVRVFYNKKKDTVHLSSTDEDFPSGFHMTLNKGSQTDEMLRDILEEQGMLELRPPATVSLPDRVELTDHGVTTSIPLGQDENENVFSWAPMKSLEADMAAALYIQARVGQGSALLLDQIIEGLKLRSYEVFYIDYLGLSAEELQESVIPELSQRIYDTPERFAVAIDDLYELLKNDTFKELFNRLLRLARSKAIVVVAKTSQLCEDYLHFFSDYIVVSRSDVQTSQTIFGDDTSSSAVSDERGGAAFRTSRGRTVRFKINSKLSPSSKFAEEINRPDGPR